MNKKLILIALFVAMFCSASYAQKVIKQGNAVIIDCSSMDSRFYDAIPKPRTTDATNTSIGTDDATQISSLARNTRVYKKFEVHGSNNHTGIDWKSAITLCANLNSNGGGWRLPTHRELMLMWILKEKLVANGCSAFANTQYWSATNSTTVAAWYMDFGSGTGSNSDSSTGSANHYGKIIQLGARCIRDM